MGRQVFEGTAPGFTIYYLSSSTGFSQTEVIFRSTDLRAAFRLLTRNAIPDSMALCVLAKVERFVVGTGTDTAPNQKLIKPHLLP